MTATRQKHNEGVRETSHKQFKEEQKKEMELKQALAQLPERDRKLADYIIIILTR